VSNSTYQHIVLFPTSVPAPPVARKLFNVNLASYRTNCTVITYDWFTDSTMLLDANWWSL